MPHFIWLSLLFLLNPIPLSSQCLECFVHFFFIAWLSGVCISEDYRGFRKHKNCGLNKKEHYLSPILRYLDVRYYRLNSVRTGIFTVLTGFSLCLSSHDHQPFPQGKKGRSAFYHKTKDFPETFPRILTLIFPCNCVTCRWQWKDS